MNTNTKIIAGVVALIIAGGLFYGGMKVGEAKAQNNTQGNFATQGGRNFGGANGGGAGGRRGANGAGGFISGDVLSKDATSVTVKLGTGGSKIIFTSPSTVVSKQATGSLSDIVVGTQVSVQGTTNSDGGVTAQMIQIRPALLRTGSTTTAQ